MCILFRIFTVGESFGNYMVAFFNGILCIFENAACNSCKQYMKKTVDKTREKDGKNRK
jgi:hypothetical protein